MHKGEDSDRWAIETTVRFRGGETLQILDQHRQSGGERAVSTIFSGIEALTAKLVYRMSSLPCGERVRRRFKLVLYGWAQCGHMRPV